MEIWMKANPNKFLTYLTLDEFITQCKKYEDLRSSLALITSDEDSIAYLEGLQLMADFKLPVRLSEQAYHHYGSTASMRFFLNKKVAGYE